MRSISGSLGSSVGALDLVSSHSIAGALERSTLVLERTNRNQIGSFAQFYPLNHIFVPLTYSTLKLTKPLDINNAKSLTNITQGRSNIQYLALITRHMRQLLDRCENSTGRMLGLANIYYLSGELVEPISYKYPLPSYVFLTQIATKLCKNLSFMSVCCEFMSFRS